MLTLEYHSTENSFINIQSLAVLERRGSRTIAKNHVRGRREGQAWEESCVSSFKDATWIESTAHSRINGLLTLTIHAYNEKRSIRLIQSQGSITWQYRMNKRRDVPVLPGIFCGYAEVLVLLKSFLTRSRAHTWDFFPLQLNQYLEVGYGNVSCRIRKLDSATPRNYEIEFIEHRFDQEKPDTLRFDLPEGTFWPETIEYGRVPLTMHRIEHSRRKFPKMRASFRCDKNPLRSIPTILLPVKVREKNNPVRIEATRNISTEGKRLVVGDIFKSYKDVIRSVEFHRAEMRRRFYRKANVLTLDHPMGFITPGQFPQLDLGPFVGWMIEALRLDRKGFLPTIICTDASSYFFPLMLSVLDADAPRMVLIQPEWLMSHFDEVQLIADRLFGISRLEAAEDVIRRYPGKVLIIAKSGARLKKLRRDGEAVVSPKLFGIPPRRNYRTPQRWDKKIFDIIWSWA